MIKTFNIVVLGRVQRVGYRGWALGTANRLGLSGWVKNINNGNVEIVIKGEEYLIKEMIQKCQKGPVLARVDNIVVNEIKNDAYLSMDAGFKIL